MTTWNVDPSHAQIQFSAKHMGIFTVRGQFETFDINFNYDPAQPENAEVDVKIDASSINTRNAQRDGHLTSADFLNAEEYPYIRFASNRVELVNESTAQLLGELTIRDITREVALDVELTGQATSPWGTTSTGFIAKGTINRTEWGLTWNQVLETGGVLVGEEIGLSIELEAIQQAASEAVA